MLVMDLCMQLVCCKQVEYIYGFFLSINRVTCTMYMYVSVYNLKSIELSVLEHVRYQADTTNRILILTNVMISHEKTPSV